MSGRWLKLIAAHEDEYLKIRENGVCANSSAFVSASGGVPQIPQNIYGIFVAFMPARSKSKYDDGGNIGRFSLFGLTSISLSTYLVAVSTDKRKKWKSFESEADRRVIDKVLPETVGKLIVPAKLADAFAE